VAGEKAEIGRMMSSRRICWQETKLYSTCADLYCNVITIVYSALCSLTSLLPRSLNKEFLIREKFSTAKCAVLVHFTWQDFKESWNMDEAAMEEILLTYVKLVPPVL
jgi:hypothetical protein